MVKWSKNSNLPIFKDLQGDQDAGYEEIVLVCDATVKRRNIQALFESVCGTSEKVRFLTTRQLLQRLEEIWEGSRKAPPSASAASGTVVPAKAMPEAVGVSNDERRAIATAQLRAIQERKLKA